MEMIPYADWPECQIMQQCKHSDSVGDNNGIVCLKNGECNCLKKQETLPEDMKLFEEEDISVD